MSATVLSNVSADHQSGPMPVRLRPATATAIGTTAFFRNRPLFQTLLEHLSDSGRDRYTVLFHASSIGTEVYSLLVAYLLGRFNQRYHLHCLATDKEAEFLAFASRGHFPTEVLAGMTDAERKYFRSGSGGVDISSQIRQRVTFLPASDFTRFSPGGSFDVVMLLNAMLYVPAEVQPGVMDKIGSYNSDVLAITGFHPDSIKADLQRNRYRPITRNIDTIHEAWTDRRVPPPATPEQRPGIYADWRLPPFSEIPDFEYRYCALFQKQNS